MAGLAERKERALKLWKQGDLALASTNRDRAYKLYTEAHDAIVDEPKMHCEAHRKLRQVTRHHADKREYITDTLLVWLAPVGIFRLIAAVIATPE